MFRIHYFSLKIKNKYNEVVLVMRCSKLCLSCTTLILKEIKIIEIVKAIHNFTLIKILNIVFFYARIQRISTKLMKLKLILMGIILVKEKTT